ncbi:DUF6884 domain-containing protein [Cupriavidus pinatubonensis]|uniref:DUF6884 domain-containing protein n=1 Tax=Cupriavidus pinatubonensis TaxID=248026 RepID=A0ABN7ZHF7_9BURK|nr:DUF6884 domain-containing protein [Cupriavidus pinatubonensis]CAG9183730.1 hypothetical protein LMG23994_05233 [Cupriavidus pinatubonensis]
MPSTAAQLTLLATAQDEVGRASTPAPALLLLACSGTKLDHPAPAIELYRGVMYQSYRAHVRHDAAPHVLILSAKHGFLDPHAEIAPYDERMTSQRGEQMLTNLPAYPGQTDWPSRIGKVMLAGGQQYRRVMRAALVRRYGEMPPFIRETEGGIGMQRSQLGAFLDGLALSLSEPFGQYPNGTPLFRRYAWIETGALTSLVYRAVPDRPALKARVLALFEGPSGPTADVEVEEMIRGRPKISARWVRVSVKDLQPLTTREAA